MNRDDNYNSGMSGATTRFLARQDFNKLITPKLRKKFIKKIFNNDQKDYEKFAALIQNINNWKDANILIDFYFYKNGVDPVSREALEFRNILYHIYYPK